MAEWVKSLIKCVFRIHYLETELEIFILCHKMLNHPNFRGSVEDLLKRSEGYLFAAWDKEKKKSCHLLLKTAHWAAVLLKINGKSVREVLMTFWHLISSYSTFEDENTVRNSYLSWCLINTNHLAFLQSITANSF